VAKKPKYFLEYKLSAEFPVQIVSDGVQTLLDDLKRNEVCLTLNYTIGDSTMSGSVYPDYIEDGELTFTQISDNKLRVSVKGSYLKYLDPKWEQNIIDDWKSLEKLKVYSNSIYDTKPTFHYINGSEDDFEIGTVSLVHK